MAKSLLSLLIASSLVSSSLAGEPDSGLHDCFISDRAYSGTPITSLTTGCSRECQRKCEGNGDCLFWTYSADSVGLHDCILFSSGTPVAATGKISGPKRCSEPYHCLHKGLEVGNSPMKVLNSENEYKCYLECKLVSNCVYSNWTVDKKCHLKDGNALNNVKFGIEESTAIPQDCSEGWCYLFGRHLQCSGSDYIQAVNDIPTAKKCQETCRLKNGCDFWSWNKNGEKKCHLMKLNCYKRNNLISDSNAVSGPKRCGSGTLCHEGYNYRGGDIRWLDAENAEECNDICFHDTRCEYFTFGLLEKRCWLKSSESLKGRIQNRNHISGPAICHGKPSCYELDVDYRGSDIRTTYDVADPFKCAKECKNTFGCNLVTFSDPRKECYLKKSNIGTTRREGKGLISVPLQCLFDTNS